MGRPWQALRALRLRLLGPEKELVGTDQFGNKYYRVPKHETRAGQTAQEETGSSCEHLMADELSYDSTEGVVIPMCPPASSSSHQLKVSPDGGSVVSETVHTVSSLNIPFGVSSQGVFRGLPSVVLKETTDDEADISVNLETFAFRDKRQIIPERRFVEAINRQAYQYEMGDFPTEWEAWIRKKRNDPPTIEEILKNENYREEMKQKIKDVSEKDKLLQAKEYKEGLVAEPVHTQVKGHASAPYYGKKEPSQDPTSIASTFQPGSWMPPGSGSGHNK